MDPTKSFGFQILASAITTALILGAAYLMAGIVIDNGKAVVDGVRDGLREK